MKNLVKKPVFIVGLIIICVILGIFFLGRSKKPAYNFVVAKKGEVIQKVSVTGRAKSAEKIDLAFEKSGRVDSINVKIGAKVSPGQILIKLENADVAAQLAQAEAGVKVQKAKLDELKAGTREEEIGVKEAELRKAQQDLINDYDSINDVLDDAYNKADDAVRKQMDELFSNDEELSPQLTFLTSDSQVKIDVEFQRLSLTYELKKWKEELEQPDISSTLASLEEGLENAKSRLIMVRNFLNQTMDAVLNAAVLSQTTINAYKTNINTARTNINTALTNVNNQQQTIASQELTVEKIQNEFYLKLAGAVPEQIAAQEAEVEQAEASVKNYQAQFAKTILRSPINGIVAKQDAEVGEIIAANTLIISLISEAKLEIETNIPESDIAKVKIGDSAEVTLDAYGNEVIFEATVAAIDPAETIIEGVAAYKTTLYFTKEDERIKPGMTANIDILTDKRVNAITIPQRAVISKNGDKFVKILDSGGTIKETPVKIGLRGSDGDVEIIEGVREGDKVIISSGD